MWTPAVGFVRDPYGPRAAALDEFRVAAGAGVGSAGAGGRHPQPG
jgi:hypothetical protein